MISYSIIQKSQLEGAHRLDAEYYQPEYLEFSKKLVNVGEILLGEIAFITDGQHGYHVIDPESNIRHITAKNVVSWLVNDNDAEKLSKLTNDRNKRSILEEGDLLISTAGTTGEIGLVTNAILPANIDQDVARIHVLDRKSLNPYFLVAFLNSKYGQFQLLRQITGQIQTHISLDKLKNNVFIPIPKWQDEIVFVVREAIRAVENSTSLYSQAENLLLEELGLKDFKSEDDLFNVVNLSDVKSAGRMDAEYFQPKYEKLVFALEAKDVRLLSEVIENVPARFIPKQDETYKYVELADINVSIGLIDGFSEVLGKEAPSRAKRVLRSGDVVVSSVEGSLEKVALAEKEQEKYLASTGFFQLRSKEILPEVLLVLAGSIVFQMQLERICTGTILTAVPKGNIDQVLVPILPKSTQQKIADLVRKSHESRKKAKELLEEVKCKVEEMIEDSCVNKNQN